MMTALMRFLSRSVPWQASLILSLAALVHAEEKDSPFPEVHEYGEWYQVGWQLGLEVAPIYGVFDLDASAQKKRLVSLLNQLGVETGTLTARELEMVRKGWEDGIDGKDERFLRPPDQARSLVPKPLQGFHTFAAAAPALADLVSEWKQGVVVVRAGDGHGTGFFIGPKLLVTNHHVIEGVESIAIEQHDGRRDSAYVIASTPTPDIALLRTSVLEGEVHLKLGDSSLVKDLQEVVLIGYPLTDKVSATIVKGAISSAAGDRRLDGLDMFQVDIRSYGGSSGGPLLTLNGHVIGIHTSSIRGLEGFKFAQRLNSVLPFLNKHVANEFVYETAE
jgi:S1-C subfamily serine protease